MAANYQVFTYIALWFSFGISLTLSEIKACSPRDYGNGKTVCVCSQSYCDSIGPIKIPDVGLVRIYESNDQGWRFNQTDGHFTAKYLNNTESEITVSLNASEQYQEILGFGGAFTDAAGININSLSFNLQQEIIKGYYSSEGLDYNIGRVPIASCDFSTRTYSYCDEPDDFNLVNFKLAQEDLQYKIPFIQQALNVSGKPLLFFGSPWSSPYWMKTNNKMNGDGVLKGDIGGPYYQAWADYFVKFLQAYEQHNIKFWGVTAQNEPLDCYIKDFSFQCLGFTAQLQRDFIKIHLGPTLKRAGYGTDKLKLMIMDDQLFQLPKWAEVVLDEATVDYVSGIAFHWYTNFLVSRKLLDITHSKFPNKFLLSTEACTGSIMPPKVDIGSWKRGEDYAHDIIQDLLHYTTGWVDWNLALDLQGGPNWVKNFVDSPILVNATANEFYRQPMYYVLGHFSKFLPKGSIRIGMNVPADTKVELAAFKRPDNATVFIAVNRNNEDTQVTIRDPEIGQFSHKVPGHSIQSYIWKNAK